MTYEEFEWNLLRMAYEEGVATFAPTFLSYSMQLPHDQVEAFLSEAMDNGIVEVCFNDKEQVEYIVPGAQHAQELPPPVWKAQTPEQPAKPVERSKPRQDPMMGSVTRGQDAADGGLMHRAIVSPKSVVLSRNVLASAQPAPIASSGAMVLHQPPSQALMTRDSEDAFCDPSQTIFMRQITVRGFKSEALLRDHVRRLFESFGYKHVEAHAQRLKFERGSVTFILALVPLFVLVVPLFVYLFLYCMGRSTIQQEPLELDVMIRPGKQEDSYVLDLTFVGLHGVVLGAADQRVLNQEIDTLRDELNWAQSAS